MSRLGVDCNRLPATVKGLILIANLIPDYKPEHRRGKCSPLLYAAQGDGELSKIQFESPSQP